MIERIRHALAGRRLIWFGIRGEDAEPLRRLPEFESSFSHTAGLEGVPGKTLEEIAGTRPDLDRYELDRDKGEAASRFRAELLTGTEGACVLMTYRPAGFVSDIAYARRQTMTLAGLLAEQQRRFEHKPWVETQLEARGVRTLGWRYVLREDCGDVESLLDRGPVVLRPSRSSGGVGVVRVDSMDELVRLWPVAERELVGVAPFVDPAVPVNLSACVFRNGDVRLHPPSLQLIGIRSCIDRPFGYCGNDLAAASVLSGPALDGLETLTRKVAAWLHEQRYVGAFGLDALVSGDAVYFVEINARFQGSSALSAVAAEALEVPDLFLDHLAGMLGLDPVDRGLGIRDWAERQPPLAHVVVHNNSTLPARRTGEPSEADLAEGVSVSQLLPMGVSATPGGVLFRLVMGQATSSNGISLRAEDEAAIARVKQRFAAV